MRALVMTLVVLRRVRNCLSIIIIIILGHSVCNQLQDGKGLHIAIQ